MNNKTEIYLLNLRYKLKEFTKTEVLYERYKLMDIPKGVYEWANKKHEDFINTLYYPVVYVFPVDEEGEEMMNLFFENDIISYKYGAYIITNKCPIDGVVYNIVIENND